MQRPRRIGIANDNLDTKNVFHEPTEVSQLLIRTNQPIQAENAVDDLVPDLFLGLDSADELVHTPLVLRSRLVLDHIRHEARPAPDDAVVIAQTPQLASAEIEVGLRVQVSARKALCEREAFPRRIDFTDHDALKRVPRIQERVAQQLADPMQLLLALPNHPPKRSPDLAQP